MNPDHAMMVLVLTRGPYLGPGCCVDVSGRAVLLRLRVQTRESPVPKNRAPHRSTPRKVNCLGKKLNLKVDAFLDPPWRLPFKVRDSND
jgi:hypothetical protein